MQKSCTIYFLSGIKVTIPPWKLVGQSVEIRSLNVFSDLMVKKRQLPLENCLVIHYVHKHSNELPPFPAHGFLVANQEDFPGMAPFIYRLKIETERAEQNTRRREKQVTLLKTNIFPEHLIDGWKIL